MTELISSPLFWIVVVVVGGIAWALGAARTRKRYRGALERLAGATERGDPEPTAGERELPGLRRLGAVLREVVASGRDERSGSAGQSPGEVTPASPSGAGAEPVEEDLVQSALSRVRAYLHEGVEEPLRAGIEGEGPDLRARAEDALVAVEDLYFYLREVPEDRSPEDLNELARTAGDEYRNEWGIDVDVLVPERPTSVEVHREAFLDALYLVLHNAGTFGDGGPVEVVVRYQDGDCWLVVRDRGEGFTDEALDRAFEPFYTTSRLGLGLGLYHVRKIVQAMGGTVQVRNRRGGGGQVEIVLPEAE